ncbi:hypothetical protein [Novosphingobium sp. 9]|uniref:head-tail joining protein n=1 Tax=Novosphingobium sp. 9 TaxID=2025349 RepID=UPI0021B6865D|nr:hypothetical protein [Novosphingobium sp. 9]
MSIDWDSLVLGPAMGIFGDEVIYTPRGGVAVTIPDAVVDDEATELQMGEDGQTSIQKRPLIGIRAAALAAEAQQGDRVKVVKTGKVYVVREPIPDGHGHVLLKVMATA